MDKTTYTGQFRSRRKLFLQQMEEPKKHQLRALHYRLGSLLSQRQALNSKVVSRNFDYFIDAIEEDADAVDIKSRLNRLEQALKQEGLFKNVKTEFQYMKKEVVAVGGHLP